MSCCSAALRPLQSFYSLIKAVGWEELREGRAQPLVIPSQTFKVESHHLCPETSQFLMWNLVCGLTEEKLKVCPLVLQILTARPHRPPPAPPLYLNPPLFAEQSFSIQMTLQILFVSPSSPILAGLPLWPAQSGNSSLLPGATLPPAGFVW